MSTTMCGNQESMAGPKYSNVTPEEIFRYIIDHRNEDFPMDQTLTQFYQKVEDYSKLLKEQGVE